ncbi:MAG: CoA transferase [Deltaproteobacteria bacterium]|nr:CoA transferase [Deltaproteobacteria bacterium]
MDIFRNMTILSLEQATVLPYLSYRLAMDGCRVIRLEHPVFGDPNRLVGDPFLAGEERMNSYFMAINSGKEALTLNLGDPRGQEILTRLVGGLKVDVFATNQLPKNYKKLGIDYDSLKALKEDIIWVGITGFGPNSNDAAYDPILQARGGLMELTGEPGSTPQVTGIPLPDMGTSEHTYGLIMKALFVRAMTGKGSRIDVSMFESTTSWLTVPITMTRTFGKKISRRGNTHEFFAPVSVYPTRDGYVYIAVGNDKQFMAFSSLPEFSSLAREDYKKNAGRIADVRNLNQAISEVAGTMTTDSLVEKMNQIGVAASKISTITEVMEDPLVLDKLLRAKDEKTGFELTLAPAPASTPFLEANQRRLSFPPRFGEHNEAILGKELGMSSEEIAALKTDGII